MYLIYKMFLSKSLKNNGEITTVAVKYSNVYCSSAVITLALAVAVCYNCTKVRPVPARQVPPGVAPRAQGGGSPALRRVRPVGRGASAEALPKEPHG